MTRTVSTIRRKRSGIGDSNQIGDAPGNSPTREAALGIQWGADNNDTGADGADQDAPDGRRP